MNKLSTKIAAGCLCAVLIFSGTGVAYALAGGESEAAETAQTQEQEKEKEKLPEAAEADTAKENAEEGEALSKDETVYILADADGSVQKIIVSDWIKNPMKEEQICDRSELSGIENVKGDETYTVSDDNMTVWDAGGNDIYYRGETEKELPVTVKVSYKLDGQPVSAEEIAGKSGRVTIRFDYENKQYETAEIEGKEERIFVPFTMLTGVLLDSDIFSNVEVSNGKLINDGDRTAVIGIAFPGLKEDLGIDGETVMIPDYVEINADASGFELGTTMTVAANGIFNELDTEKLETADDLNSSLNELTDGMQQLMDGSSALYDGLCTLLDKSGELTDGVKALADGADKLKNGAASLDDGVTKLQAGAGELSSGLNTLASNNASLNGGAQQVFDSLLSTAASEIKAAGISVPALTIQNYAEVLNGVISSLDKTAVYNQALAQVTAEVEKNRPLITQKVTEAVREQVSAQVTAAVKEQVTEGVKAAVREQVSAQVISAAAGMSPENYEAAVAAGAIPEEQQKAIEAAIEAQMETDEVKALIEAAIAEKMDSDEIKAAVTENTDAQMQSDELQKTISDNVEVQVKQAISENMASDEVQAKLAAASEGAGKLISLKTALDSYNAFYLGLRTYTDGVASAANGAAALSSGAADLKSGSEQLKAGSASLNDGILQLQNGLPAMTDGVTQLKDGAMQLSDGLREFNEEGIRKIVDWIDGDLEELLARARAAIDASKNYQNFSGIGDMEGKVKFIYRTDEIKIK